MGKGLSRLPCLEGFVQRAAVSPTGTPLPRVLHRKLRRRDVCRKAGGRLIIVGDVHGCASELQQLLDAEKFDSRADTVVLVGDLVNKGPDSGEVLRIARACGALAVRGNHDDELLEAWHCVGRFARGLEGYKQNALFQVSAEDIRWLQELPLTLSFPWLSLVVVHAGLVPGAPLERQTFKDLLWLRDVRLAGQGDSGSWVGMANSEEGSLQWASMWKGPEHVVFGHDARRKLQNHKFATGLDSGCCYGFHLSALVVDPDDFSQRRLVQVPAMKMYSMPKDGSGAAKVKAPFTGALGPVAAGA
mmetsp:Transcript_130713/g.279531  ORF Transcript_130713/g.279531 Transcript_130713/m.279531 type:complete len:302 (-) Transcript_130713:141-1046(-)